MAGGITLCGSLSLHASPLGVAMHEAGYRALALDWRYVPFEVASNELGSALQSMRTLRIRGFGISMPFKQQILPLLDRIDPTARDIGAVNTVVNDAGALIGHNTDAVGAVRALCEVVSLPERRVLLLGAGGAARAVGFGLVRAGASVRVSNRTDAKAGALAESLGVDAVPWAERAEASSEVDVVVNATSAGMVEIDPAPPLPPAAFRADLVVMDIVYKPLRTALLEAAQRTSKDCTTVHGGRMLLHQAARQFELYTSRPAPLEAMDEALTRFVV